MKLIRILLFPVAISYNLITRIRNLFFDLGIFSSTSFKTPIIAVGNLSVGGTGKTPQIEYLIRLFLENHKVAVLSRGYGRSTKGFVQVKSTSNSAEVGDEPLQFYKKFEQITVAVDEKRVHGVQELLAQTEPANLILLDDAFQHRAIKAGYYLLLTKYDELFVHDFLLPTGRLRESAIGAKRADAIVVSKCPSDLDLKEQEQIINALRRNFKGPIFFSSISYADQVQNNLGDRIPLSNLKDYEIVLVTGIAKPSPLLDFLQEKGIHFQHLKFKDHHEFSNEDIKQIVNQFSNLKSDQKIILTTEKDFVRLEDQLDTLYYLEIQTKLLDKESDFNKLFFDYLTKKL